MSTRGRCSCASLLDCVDPAWPNLPVRARLRMLGKLVVANLDADQCTESSSERILCAGPSRSSDWPCATDHQNAAPTRNTNMTERGMSRYRISTVTLRL